MPPLPRLWVLACLAVLCTCSPPPPEPAEGPRLPERELLETTEGAPLEASLAASGGTPPLAYSASALPPGLSVEGSTGVLRGQASAAGRYTPSLRVSDSRGQSDSRSYTLLVQPAPTVSTSSLPGATAGVAYQVQLQAAGGVPPLRWSPAEGLLPPGLSLSEQGVLAGVPGSSGTFFFTVRVQESYGARAQRQLSLAIQPGQPGVDGGSLDGGVDAGVDGGTVAFSAANWNVEWFGDPVEGPVDDGLQLENVRRVVADTGADFWALAEVVDTADFEELRRQLPGYEGFVASDPVRVPGGSSWYSADEQKLAVLFRSGVVSVRRAEVILTAYNYDFAGRPPLRVDLSVSRNGTSVDLVAILLHLKAFSTLEDYQRRQSASAALKSYLDSELPTERVLVLGDWNDDVDRSTVRVDGGYLETPFRNFLSAPAAWTFLTAPLSEARQRTTVSGSEFIDHQLASNELVGGYVADSAVVIRPAIPGYGNTTSDHYPVLSRYELAP